MGGYLLDIARSTGHGTWVAGSEMDRGEVLGGGGHHTTGVIKVGPRGGPTMAEIPAMVKAVKVFGTGLGHGAAGEHLLGWGGRLGRRVFSLGVGASIVGLRAAVAV